MDAIRSLAKLIIFTGIILIVFGGILYFAGKIPGIGRLPGDIVVQKKNFSFYFPLTTCIIISLALTLIFLLFRR